MPNTKTSLQQKLAEPTFTDLQNTIFNNRENIPTVQEHPNQEAQVPHLQIPHNNLQVGLQYNQHFQHCIHFLYFLRYPTQESNQPLQEGPNTCRKVFTTERPTILQLPHQPSPSKNTSPPLLWQLSGLVNSMVWTLVAYTMMSIDF